MGTEESTEVLTDEQLMARFTATGDDKCFVEVFERHRERITGYLTKRTRGDFHLAEDLSQEVFRLAYKNHEKARGRPVIGWLLMIATNCAIDLERAKKSKKRAGEVVASSVMKFGTAWHPLDESSEPVAIASGREDVGRLKRALAALRPDKREMVQAVFLHGMSRDEYAAKLKVPLGTICSRLDRALKELRGLLTEDDEGTARRTA